MFDIVVRRLGRTWNVVYVEGDKVNIIEGGFFSRPVAERAARMWDRELRQDMAETAERKAGWRV